MNKMLITLIALTLFCSTAFADEITFRGIPWGANVQTAIEILGWDDELVRHNETLSQIGKTPETDDPLVRYFVSNEVSEVGYLVYDGKNANDNCGYQYGNYYYKDDQMIVAGHGVWSIELEFLYGTENGQVIYDQASSEFVKGTYCFMGKDMSVYDDILDKLKWKYGEPIDSNETITDYPKRKVKEAVTIWEDENRNRIVCSVRATGEYSLEKRDYIFTIDRGVKLEYGKSNIDERLAVILESMKATERNDKYNEANTDGL